MLKKENRGFTLLELLIAMVIFSFMSIMAYGALANIFNSNERIKTQEENLKALKRTMMVLERDMRQITLRPRRLGYDQLTPALVSGLNAGGLIEFTRAGNTNPLDLVRSSLQRVQYDFQDGQILRMSWNLVDHIEAEPIIMPLLGDVDSFSLRFLSKKNVWEENWDSDKTKSLPVAIEITIEHKKWGKIVRLIPVQ